MGCQTSLPQESVYSVPVYKEFNPNAGETPAYRHPTENDLVTGIKNNDTPYLTLQQLYINLFETHKEKQVFEIIPELEEAEIEHYTYEDLLEKCKLVGSGILNINLAPLQRPPCSEFRFIATTNFNRPEYSILDIACCLYGIGLVVLDENCSVGAKWCSDVEITSLFTTKSELEKIFNLFKEKKLSTLKSVVCVDFVETATKLKFEGVNLKIIEWNDIIAEGEKYRDFPEVNENTCYTLIPNQQDKGVIITQNNIISSLAALNNVKQTFSQDLSDSDKTFWITKPYEISSRIFLHFCISNAFLTGFSLKAPAGSLEDLKKFQPSLLFSSSKCIEEIENYLLKEYNELEQNSYKKDLITNGLKSKISGLKENGDFNHAFYDNLIFRSMRAKLGSRLKAIILGGKTEIRVREHLRVILSSPVYQISGYPETCGVGFLNPNQRELQEFLGGPIPCSEFKLQDVKYMDYKTSFHENEGENVPKGELCIRGKNVFLGYYRDQKTTAAVKDADGWFHTGDIAEVSKEGAFNIIEKKTAPPVLEFKQAKKAVVHAGNDEPLILNSYQKKIRNKSGLFDKFHSQNPLIVQNIWFNGKLLKGENQSEFGTKYIYEYDTKSEGFLRLQYCAVLSSEAVFDIQPPESRINELNALEPKEREKEKRKIQFEHMKKLDKMKMLDKPTLGDEYESAIIKFYQPIEDIQSTRQKYPLLKLKDSQFAKIPFNPVWEYSLSILFDGTTESDHTIVLQGDILTVWNMCSKIAVDDVPTDIDEHWDKKFDEALHAFKDVRTLAFAYLPLNKAKYALNYKFDVKNPFEPNYPMEGFIFAGIISFIEYRT